MSDREQLQRKIQIQDIPAFMNYLKVCEDDDEYIENILDKLVVLQEDDFFVNEGLSYDELF